MNTEIFAFLLQLKQNAQPSAVMQEHTQSMEETGVNHLLPGLMGHYGVLFVFNRRNEDSQSGKSNAETCC